MKMILKMAALLALSPLLHASVNTRPLPSAPLSNQLQITRDDIAAAADAWRNHDTDATYEALQEAINSAGFAQLDKKLQYSALSTAASIAQKNGKYDAAHGLLIWASDYSLADGETWLDRLEAASASKDDLDSALCVTTIARRWPESLGRVNYVAIFELWRRLVSAGASTPARQDLLQALFDAHWTTPEGPPDVLWRDLAAILLNGNHVKQATHVALRIQTARDVLLMRIDKRFDRITRKNPQAFDVNRVAAAQVTRDREAAAASPDELMPVTTLQTSLMDTCQFQQVLTLTDDILAKSHGVQGSSSYKDFNDRYIWVLDQRARALVALGRWNEAIEQWQLATRHPEYGGMNVSQIVNLGNFYAETGRPHEALDLITELGNTTVFARMQLEWVYLVVAVQQKDTPAIASHMAYLQAHRTDDIVTWQAALLLTEDLDDAADLLIERLGNVQWRTEALADMQQYADVRTTPIESELKQRWQTVIARSQVQAALSHVGRIEHFNLSPAQR